MWFAGSWRNCRQRWRYRRICLMPPERSIFTIYRRATRTVTMPARPGSTTGGGKAMRLSAVPVRSLTSAVFKWPDRDTVLSAARQWAQALCRRDASVEQVACVGSYARGDWGVGSDLDVIIVLTETTLSSAQRYARYYPDDLPVPVDLWVYTRKEWDGLPTRSPHLRQRLQRERLDLASSPSSGSSRTQPI